VQVVVVVQVQVQVQAVRLTALQAAVVVVGC
jgi:hypothetical protein